MISIIVVLEEININKLLFIYYDSNKRPKLNVTINSINNGRLQHQNNIPFIFIFFLFFPY